MGVRLGSEYASDTYKRPLLNSLMFRYKIKLTKCLLLLSFLKKQIAVEINGQKNLKHLRLFLMVEKIPISEAATGGVL